MNLHQHVHAVASDGVFLAEAGAFGAPRLGFKPAEAPSEAELGRVLEGVRRKLLRRLVGLAVLEREAADEMLAWRHSGFSLHAGTTVARGDRAALERLLYYCGRPAISTRRLSYRKADGLVVYDARDKAAGSRRLVLTPLAFIGRLARLVPPARKNIVRYYGALAPNSPLRPLVARAARELSKESPMDILCRAAGEALRKGSESARAWAKILSRVFEVNPLVCSRCGSRLVPVAAIFADKQLARLLAHLGLPTEFPKLAPARSRPVRDAEESQLGPDPPLSDSIDWLPPDDLPAPTGDQLGA